MIYYNWYVGERVRLSKYLFPLNLTIFVVVGILFFTFNPMFMEMASIVLVKSWVASLGTIAILGGGLYGIITFSSCKLTKKERKVGGAKP